MPADWKNTALDLVFPPLCQVCRAPVGAGGGVCATCWSTITFLDSPACACCGIPFPVELGEAESLCAACHGRRPAFDTARAILAYDEHSRVAVLALKHADRLDLVPGFARWLARVGKPALADSDLIVPVPLHPWRLWRRRYNQSAELARRLARDGNLPADPFALVRTRSTPSQGAMASARARRRNVLAAFKVPEAARVAGRRILLIDDVLTTGATAESCARALKRAGAVKVHVLALARVVRAAEMTI
ncbi:MAG TPA: ComF family protein [Rhizomicrobium sp.]|jgi:ComF family protein|nr:ComF family protein [Rhizomicrobium sp.]